MEYRLNIEQRLLSFTRSHGGLVFFFHKRNTQIVRVAVVVRAVAIVELDLFGVDLKWRTPGQTK